MTPAIITFARSGAETAARAAAATGGEVIACGPDGAAGTLLARLFAEGRPIVGVCAAGILIRLLAPYLTDKQSEPPVIALSQDGAYVIPLLGGHHGANALAEQLARALGGVAALTTASSARFSRGLDEPPPGYLLEDIAAAKPAMAALLGGASIALEGDAPWLAEAGYPLAPDGAVRVRVTHDIGPHDGALIYRPQVLVAGVGCERGADSTEVIGLIAATLAEAGLSAKSLSALATIEIKSDEPALLDAAAHFGVPLRLFTASELAAERDRLPNPSAIVEAETGTPGVAEAAALKAGTLIVPKRKSGRATCAIGIAPAPIDPQALGRAPGVLHLVGIGPGEARQRTASAVMALDISTDWVGYGLYLDLVADLRRDQSEHRFPLGGEEDRVRHALELAATGRTVALVCSGDAQIYAMAALVYELVEGGGATPVSDAARRVRVDSLPGISAVQAASAAAGALIGHDFCCISLSDLLTPRAAILKRLEAAAAGDFVTAFYNPRSQRRTDLIETAKTVFMAHRPPTTPVIVATSLGRPEERVTVTTLAEFDPTTVDMMTIVLFGAAASRAYQRGDGRTVAFTPRGYANKERPA